MPFLIVRQDITKIKADAIVNTANTNLLQGSGTSRGIYLAAGEEQLTKACEKIGHCDIGKAVITDGFNLPAKFIIHAVGPVWLDGTAGEEKFLYSAYMEALKLAKEYSLESIAFPLISSGNYKFPKGEALRIANMAINNFLQDNDMMVYLVIYDKQSLEVSKKLFASIDEYIDDNYIMGKDQGYAELALPRFNDVINQKEASKTILAQVMEGSTKDSLEEILMEREETFPQLLFRLIDERGMTDVQTYRKANVDRKLFSKIRSNPHYNPSKKTIFCFAIALELSMEETTELLMKAGYSFSNCSKFDLIIAYFIKNNKYDIFEINEVLFQYDLPILGAL